MGRESVRVGTDPRYSQMGQRKVIALSVAPGDSFGDSLYAVCDDGTIWILEAFHGSPWLPLPAIPQPNEQQEPQF